MVIVRGARTIIVTGLANFVLISEGRRPDWRPYNSSVRLHSSHAGGETGKKSPLSVEITHFVMLLSTIAIILAIVFLVVGVTTVYKGPAIYGHVTICISRWSPSASLKVLRLSIATKRMAAQNILVQDLQGVETLGLGVQSCDVM